MSTIELATRLENLRTYMAEVESGPDQISIPGGFTTKNQTLSELRTQEQHLIKQIFQSNQSNIRTGRSQVGYY